MASTLPVCEIPTTSPSVIEPTLRLPPHLLGLAEEKALRQETENPFLDKIYMWTHVVIVNLGLYVSVYNVHSMSGGFIFPGTARRPTQKHFGWVWEYGAAINEQENAKASGTTYPIDEIAIRFRVHDINYPPTPLEQPKDARPFAPMVITESLDNDGLGPLSWWE